MTVRAIDVSVYQGEIVWPAVRDDGVRAAWIKVGGSDMANWYRDARGDANIAAATNAGLPCGTYYFARPTLASGAAQARHAVETCGLGRGSLPPALDLEVHNGLSGGALDQWALEFLREVERRTGVVPIVYTGAYIGTPTSGYFGTHPDLGRYRLWIANYGRINTPGITPPPWNPPLPPAWSTWSMWQFNSVTWQHGITQNTCDQDAMTDEFWLALNAVPEEWRMKRIKIVGDAAHFRLVDDAHGVLRRQHVDSPELASILEKAELAVDVVELTDPTEIDRFRRIPPTGTTIAEVGLVDVVAKATAAVQNAIAQIPDVPDTPMDEDELADRIARHFADHLRE